MVLAESDMTTALPNDSQIKQPGRSRAPAPVTPILNVAHCDPLGEVSRNGATVTDTSTEPRPTALAALPSGDAQGPASESPRSAEEPGPRKQQITPSRLIAPNTPPLVEDGHDQRSLQHRSEMVSKVGLFLGIFARIFFKPVQFPDRLSSEITTYAREGVPVYAMHTISLLDYLYLNYALLKNHLPRAFFANGVDTILFQSWRRAAVRLFRHLRGRTPLPDSEILRARLRRKQSVLVFLRRGFSLTQLGTPRAQEHHLRDLIATQRVLGFPLFVVPQVLVWQRSPDYERTGIMDAFFGDPQAPGPLRKFFGFLLNYRRAFVQFGEAINLQEFIAEHGEHVDEGLLAERLRYLLVQRFKAEDRVIRGAPMKTRRAFCDEVLGDARFQADLSAIAAEQGMPIEAARAEADRSLFEIAADYRVWMIDLFCLLLTLVWARIYEGIEVDDEGLEAVRECGRRGPVIVAPSHKSHVDYLVISYLFYRNGLIPPHIAAGANLTFWPMGPLFRKSGAFFLRRSFRGQPVYAASFRAYVRQLLRDGHWLEFFVEGTRSRTGKVLPPRYGLLRLVVEAVVDGITPDVSIIPANFGYERLIEGAAYSKELEGGEKKSESVGELLKTTQVLIHKYGRMRVQFARPLSIREELEGADLFDRCKAGDEEALDRAVKVCAFKILHGINDAGVITPTALVAAVLLTKVQRGISRADLLMRVGYILDVASRRGAVLAGTLTSAIRARRKEVQFATTQDTLLRGPDGPVDPLGSHAGRARTMASAVENLIDRVLTFFESSGWVTRSTFDDEEVFVVKRGGRLNLDYYKNNVLHLFVPDALLAATLMSVGGRGQAFDPRELRDNTKFLSRLLKFEFVYDPAVGFDDHYQTTVNEFVEAGWLATDEDGRMRVELQVMPVIQLYAKLVQNFVESYALVGKALEALMRGAMVDKDFLKHVQEQANKAFELGDVQHYEAISKVNLSNALRIFIEQGFVQERYEVQGKKRLRWLAVEVGEHTSANLATYVYYIEEFKKPWQSAFS